MYRFKLRLFLSYGGRCGFSLRLMETILSGYKKNMTFYECQQLSISKLHESFDIFIIARKSVHEKRLEKGFKVISILCAELAGRLIDIFILEDYISILSTNN